MATVTLSNLRTQVRDRSDMENTTFVTDAELTRYINSSAKELYDILVSKFEDYYTPTPTSFTLSGGDNTYTLPSDFYKLRGVDRNIATNGDWFDVPKFNFNERNRKNRSVKRAMYSGHNEIAYRIIGGELHIIPEDNADGNYRLWYVPTFTELSADGDTLDGVNGWEEYVIVDAAIKCLMKEESDVRDLMLVKQGLLNRIETMAANRDIGKPERVTDVGYNTDTWNGDWY